MQFTVYFQCTHTPSSCTGNKRYVYINCRIWICTELLNDCAIIINGKIRQAELSYFVSYAFSIVFYDKCDVDFPMEILLLYNTIDQIS